MTFRPGYKRTEESKIKQRKYWSERREKKGIKAKIKVIPEIKAHDENITTEHKNILTEININGEFKTMSETINPKKEVKTDSEPKYKCGKCAGEFNEKVKYCPHCGVEFA